MKTYITIDGGTTNTRVNLVIDRKIIATKKISRGARAGIDDKEGLKSALHDAIAELLTENDLTEGDLCKILASGMITSEFGLVELPHLTVPAGIRDLHDSMAEISFPEISSVPIVFVRGVKVNSENLCDFDMMRGEETELMGINVLSPSEGSSDRIYVLPGSHSKIIRTDSEGRIVSFATMLTGEMLMTLSQNTILKDAVDITLEGYDEEQLVNGCIFAIKEGLNKALFKVRILKNAFKASPLEVYSFFTGAILADEIKSIITSDADEVVLGGKHQIKEATAMLLLALSNKTVTVLTDDSVEASTSTGVISIFELI